VAAAPVGVLLVNLGSPAAPTAEAVRDFLGEFLSDRRVVTLPPLLWQPILRGLVLPRRAPRVAELYRRVWTPEGSPLVVIGARQAAALQARLGAAWVVRLAMRYGQPSLAEGLDALRAAGCARIVLLPLFPQQAEATTGSARAAARAALARHAPEVTLLDVPSYPVEPLYVQAVAERCLAAAAGRDIGHYVFSFHGLPVRQALGEPYAAECEATARAVATALRLPAERWSLAWQSRFGPVEWLRPYADEVVPALAARCPRVLVACPGFLADCLETLDEIGHVLAQRFRAAGGEELVLAPCANEHPALMGALAGLVRRAAVAA
jgi:protoporphyrin/coproporphyrin ferrochelatase